MLPPDIPSHYRQLRRILSEEGLDFASTYPEAAGYLDADRLEDQDPFVDRLIEGFLALQIQTRLALNAEGDGLQEHLLDLMAPDLFTPIPPVAVVRIQPKSAYSKPCTIPRGTLLRARSRTEEWKTNFLVCTDIPMVPIRCSHLQVSERTIEVTLQWWGRRGLPSWPQELPIFFHGDSALVWALMHALEERVQRWERRQGAHWIPCPGCNFQETRSSYDPSDPTPGPWANMRDFLTIDDRFRVLQLNGLQSLGISDRTLHLRLHLDRHLPTGLLKGANAAKLQINAAPCANLFMDDIEGFELDHTRSRHPLRHREPGHRIHQVSEVVGFELGSGQRFQYTPFASYRKSTSAGHFQIHRQALFNFCQSIELSGPWEKSHWISLKGWVSAANLPQERIGTGSFEVDASLPRGELEAHAWARPSSVFHPSPDLDTRRKILNASHFQVGSAAERLRDLLSLLIWDPAREKQPLVDAIQSVLVTESRTQILGVSWPLHQISVVAKDATCTPDTWDRIGIWRAFAKNLLALYLAETPIGQMLAFSLTIEPSGIPLLFHARS